MESTITKHKHLEILSQTIPSRDGPRNCEIWNIFNMHFFLLNFCFLRITSHSDLILRYSRTTTKKEKREWKERRKRKLLASRIKESWRKVVSEAVTADGRACCPQPSPSDYIVHYLVNQHYVCSAHKCATAINTDTWEKVWAGRSALQDIHNRAGQTHLANIPANLSTHSCHSHGYLFS